MQKTIFILLVLLSLLSMGWCVYRDLQIEKQYPGDLRNRVVGSRLQNDGKSPYFYKWKKEDGIRYYDPQNFDSLKVSNITATPFFHRLLYPIADLPQRRMSKAWLLGEYIALFIMALAACRMAVNRKQMLAVMVTTALFLYTNAWTGHIAAGQLYLFIPLLAMLFYVFINKKSGLVFALMAGVLTSSLVLTRPNSIIFFIPFVFIAGQYTLKYKIAFLISALSVLALAFANRSDRLFWEGYKDSLPEQVNVHQALNAAHQQNEADPHFVQWEGWDTGQVTNETFRFHYDYSLEHGNIFILINNALHVKTPVWSLAAGAVIVMLLVCILFYKRYGSTASQNTYNIAILAFCLYMISDIFSPVHRFQYNASQWLFPLLLIASRYEPRYKKIYVVTAAGLILNAMNLSFLPMQHTLGEYIIFLSILMLLFTRKLPPAQ